MFPMLLQHACAIKRKQTVGTNGRSAVQQLYAAVSCLFLPMNNKTAIENKFNIGRAYDCFFPAGQDVRAGDQLAWNGSTFTVKLVQPFQVAFASYTMAMVEQEVDPA